MVFASWNLRFLRSQVKLPPRHFTNANILHSFYVISRRIFRKGDECISIIFWFLSLSKWYRQCFLLHLNKDISEFYCSFFLARRPSIDALVVNTEIMSWICIYLILKGIEQSNEAVVANGMNLNKSYKNERNLKNLILFSANKRFY